MPIKELTRKQTKLAVKMMIVNLLSEATTYPEQYFPGIIDLRDDGKLTADERESIMIELEDFIDKLLGNDIRFRSIDEILNYVRKSNL